MSIDLIKVKTVDILKENNVDIKSALKQFKQKNFLTFERLNSSLINHNIGVSKITALDVYLILCNFFDIYVYKNSFYLELNNNGMQFVKIVNTFNDMLNSTFIENIDPLCGLEVKFCDIIKNILEKIYLSNN